MGLARKRLRRGGYKGPFVPLAAAGRPGYTVVARTPGIYGVGEMKYYDTHVSATQIAEGDSWAATEIDPATILSLFCPTEGPAINQRIGRKATVYKIKIRGQFESIASPNLPDPLPSPAVRLIVYQDMQTNSTQSQGEDLMATPAVSSTQLAFCQFQNLANIGRFKILKDKTFMGKTVYGFGDGTNTGSEVMATTPFKCSFNFPRGIEVRFNATNGGTIADIIDNSFHVIALKSTTDFVTLVNYQCRTSFKG